MKRRIISFLAASVLVLSAFSAHAIIVIDSKQADSKLTLPGSGKMIIIVSGKTGKEFKAEVVGNKLYLIGADGKKSLPKDGIYKTTDGKALSVKGGIMDPGSIRGWNPQPEPPAVPPPDDNKSLKLR